MSPTIEAAPAGSPIGPHLLQLVGEPFLFARTSYGDELVLHFGERRAEPVREVRGKEFRYESGSHRLHLRGSAWLVKSGVRVATGGFDANVEAVGTPLVSADAAGKPPIMPGAVVTGLHPFPVVRPGVDGIGLRVELSDGPTVVIIPTPDEPPEPAPPGVTLGELADWELVTPGGRLEVGPGRQWRWKPAGVTAGVA